jgi:hypothetical protein
VKMFFSTLCAILLNCVEGSDSILSQ